jgi:hypothetical protein
MANTNPTGKNKKSCTDDELAHLVESLGAKEAASVLGCTERAVYIRLRHLRSFRAITAPSKIPIKQYPHRVPIEIKDGTILIGSDLHIWPGDASTCLKALKKFIADIRPDATILNGDVMDFPRISRYPQNWESAPDPIQEIEAAQDHLNDLEKANKMGAMKVWTAGNHDMRFESMIANALPQLHGVKGVHLFDHFAIWQKAMSVFINEGVEGGFTVVKHRYKSGIYAPRNNALNAGCHIVTGHLHHQNVTAVSDYNRFDRYGVDTGCIAEKDHKAFMYCEDNPLDWRSGFALLTYRDGKLMMPELVTKWADDAVQFRGAIIKV